VGDFKESPRFRSGRLGGSKKTEDKGEINDKMDGRMDGAWVGGSEGFG
jgi:hypothetical protein